MPLDPSLYTQNPPILTYAFLAASAVTFTGYWVDTRGVQVPGSASFSTTIPGIGSAPLYVANIGTPPVGAVGARVRINNGQNVTVYWNSMDTPAPGTTPDFQTNYANYSQMIPQPEYNAIGACS